MLKILSPDKLTETFKKHFDKTDGKIFLITYIVGLITNFYFFITRGVTPDTLTNMPEHFANDWEVSLGRFSLQFFDNFRFGFVNQVITVTIALFFIALSVIMIRKIFSINSNILIFIMTAIFAAAPQFTETYEFLYCADSYLAAFFFGTVALYGTTKIKELKTSKKYLALTIVATILICSIYQAYLGVLLGLIVAYALKNIFSDKTKNVLLYFIKAMIIIFIGVCVYYVLFRIICKIIGIRPSGYKGANGLGIETIKALPTTISYAFEDFYSFFFKEQVIINNAYYHRFLIYSILLIVFVTSFTINLINKKECKVSKYILSVLLLIIFPIAVNITNLIAPGTRIMLVTGPGILITLVLFITTLDITKENNTNNILRYISCITLFFLGWTFILSNVRTYLVRENQVIQFEQVLKTVYSEATSLEGFKKDMPFAFSYNIHTPAKDYEKTNGMVTSCDISWPAYFGTTRYGHFYSQYLGIDDITFADNETYTKVINSDEFKSMNIYPDKGSVRIIDNVIVIKVSEETYLNENGEFISW